MAAVLSPGRAGQQRGHKKDRDRAGRLAKKDLWSQPAAHGPFFQGFIQRTQP